MIFAMQRSMGQKVRDSKGHGGLRAGPPVAAGLLVLALAGWFLTLGRYYLDEGLALFRLWFSARDVAASLADPALTPGERQFLEEAGRIRAFARDRLGLADTAAYTTWIRLDRPAVATVVSACAADRFDQYLWDYPVVGSLPYKGFFEPDDAKAEVLRLKDLGLDVLARGVGAFSTLGILPDPLFSDMQADPPHELAELIIHELTHATVFVAGQGDFNENLAYFVGKEGARQYLAWRHGPDSPELAAMAAAGADEASFLELVHHLYRRLDRVYRDQGLSRAQKLSIKAALFQDFRRLFTQDYGRWFKSDAFRAYADLNLNNAFIMTWRNYTARQDLYSAALAAQGGDLRQFLCWIKAELAAGRPVPGLGTRQPGLP